LPARSAAGRLGVYGRRYPDRDALSQGDPHAAGLLLPLNYHDLRELAQEKPGRTLQATILVHEVYLRLLGGAQAQDEQGSGTMGAVARALRG
jgi:hypothetical protein